MKNLTALKNDWGLLWFDSSPGRDLANKILDAALRHRKKYGTVATLCYVHPSALSGNSDAKVKRVGDVRVEALPTVLVHHFWLGVEERKAQRVDAVVQGRLL